MYFAAGPSPFQFAIFAFVCYLCLLLHIYRLRVLTTTRSLGFNLLGAMRLLVLLICGFPDHFVTHGSKYSVHQDST